MYNSTIILMKKRSCGVEINLIIAIYFFKFSISSKLLFFDTIVKTIQRIEYDQTDRKFINFKLYIKD